MNKLSFASLAAFLLTSACLVDADDDDQATSNDSNDTNDPTNDPTNDTDETTTPETSTGEETTTTTGEETSSTGAESSGSESESGSGSGGAACGWGMLGPDDDVEFGYLCGGEGEDPDGNFEMACPEDLTAGGDCTEAMITAEGCCDADGNAWYCQDPDGMGPMDPVVTMEDCG